MRRWRRPRPRLRRLRHRQRPHEVAKVVRQSAKLKANSVGGEGAARQARTLDRVLAFLDELRAVRTRTTAANRAAILDRLARHRPNVHDLSGRMTGSGRDHRGAARAASSRRQGHRHEQIQIDRHAHRQIAHPVRVELVARAASGAFRDEFGAHAARLWIGNTASKSATPSNRPPARMN